MTIDELIEELNAIKAEHGGGHPVMTARDTENISDTLCRISILFVDEKETDGYLYIGSY